MRAGVARERRVPERIGGLAGLLDHGDLGVRGHLVQALAGKLAGPAEERALGGVVVGVLGDQAGRRAGGADGGVAECDLLRAGEPNLQAGLGAGEVEAADVVGLPRGRKSEYFE